MNRQVLAIKHWINKNCFCAPSVLCLLRVSASLHVCVAGPFLGGKSREI